MTVETSLLSPATFWSTQMSRWLSARAGQNPEHREPTPVKDTDDEAFILTRPPRPIWPRVFPGL